MVFSAIIELLNGDVSVTENGETLTGTAMGVASLIVGIIAFVIGFGLWKGWKIMWYLGVIFAIIGAIGCIVSLAMGNFEYILALVVEAVIIYYLFRPGVKDFFGV